MAYTPPLEEIITLALDTRLQDVYSTLPGRVVSRDLTDNTVDVEVMVSKPVDTDEDTIAHETFPVIPAVPVLFPAANGYSITFPIAVGSTGLLLILTSSISKWLDTGNVSEPGDTRVSHVSNCVFLPGLCPKANIPASVSTNALVLDAAEIHAGAGATNFVALAPLVASNLDSLALVVNAMAAKFNAGAGPMLSAPGSITPFVATSVAATKVKAL